MDLLVELLALNEDREFEMLLEDLGNLKQLGLGRMVNAFKQSFRLQDGSRSRRYGGGPEAKVSDVGNKIHARQTGVGPNSEIIDVKGVVKNWGSIKKAYRDNLEKKPVAAVIYVENKACALIVANADALSSIKNVFGLCYDFTGLLDEDEVAEVVKGIDAFSPESRHYGVKDIESTNPKGSSRKGNEKQGYYDHDAVKVKQYEGVGVTHRNIGTFFDGMVEAFGTKLRAKVILADQTIAAKAGERAKNKPITPEEIKLFKDDIKTRLAKYKLSKVETVEDAKQFVDKVIQGVAKKLKFAGKTYFTKPGEGYWGSSNESRELEKLMKGHEVKIVLAEDNTVDRYVHGQLFVFVKLVRGMLTATRMEWTEDGAKKTEKF